jgi:nicotinamidase-related amidase
VKTSNRYATMNTVEQEADRQPEPSGARTKPVCSITATLSWGSPARIQPRLREGPMTRTKCDRLPRRNTRRLHATDRTQLAAARHDPRIDEWHGTGRSLHVCGGTRRCGMRGRARRGSANAQAEDLHGSAPDHSSTVMLVIDAINDFTFPESDSVLAAALPMARRIHRLRRAARRLGIATVYVNDNFGRWRSDFRTLVAHCQASRARGRAITRLLHPGRVDYFVLKPKHSGFYSTTLELLLEHLGARTLILTGLLADSCILFTAQDAYMRGYRLLVPEDCVAARTVDDTRRAIAQMRRALHVDTRPSMALNLGTLIRQAAVRR